MTECKHLWRKQTDGSDICSKCLTVFNEPKSVRKLENELRAEIARMEKSGIPREDCIAILREVIDNTIEARAEAARKKIH